MKLRTPLLLASALAITGAACAKSPTVAPTHGPSGTSVTITLTDTQLYGRKAGDFHVEFTTAPGGTTPGVGLAAHGHDLTCRVPSEAVSGPVWAVCPEYGDHTLNSYTRVYPDFMVATTSLTWVALAPNQGPAGTPVTATVTIDPPVRYQDVSAFDLLFGSLQTNRDAPATTDWIPASGRGYVVDGDPVHRVTFQGMVPANLPSGRSGALEVAPAVTLNSGQRLWVNQGFGYHAYRLTAASLSPKQGPVGTRVTATLTSDPPIPAARLSGSSIWFIHHSFGTVWPAVRAIPQLDADPARTLTLSADLPDWAITGPVEVTIGTDGSWSAPSVAFPGIFTVTQPKLSWGSVDPLAGTTGASVTVQVLVDPPLPNWAWTDIGFDFPGKSGGRVPARNQAGVSSPQGAASAFTLKGQVPDGAVSGQVQVSLHMENETTALLLSPQSFTVIPYQLAWESMAPQRGRASEAVSVTLSSSPPIPQSAVRAVGLAFPTAGGGLVNATEVKGAADEWPAPSPSPRVLGRVPATAATGPVTARVYLTGLSQPLSFTTPVDFLVVDASGNPTAPPMTLGKATGVPGRKLSLQVLASEAVKDLAGLSLDLSFVPPRGAPALRFVSAEAGPVLTGAIVTSRARESGARVVAVSPGGGRGLGVALNIILSVPSNAPVGSVYPVTASGSIVDSLSKVTPNAFGPGQVVVAAPAAQCGDVDGDGAVTLGDAELLLQVVVGAARLPFAAQRVAADVDGKPTINDAAMLLKVLLDLATCGGNSPSAAVAG